MNARAWRLPSARASRSDGAAELRDKAAAIAAYARQRNDTELEVWFAEIKLRASIRIGPIPNSRDISRHFGPVALRKLT